MYSEDLDSMKLDKITETTLIFLSVLVILLTSYYVERVCSHNTVASEYSTVFSLTGARLSDEVYATVEKSSKTASNKGYVTSYQFTIYNNSEVSLSNWLAFLDVGKDVEVVDNWDAGTTILDNGTLMISPEYYNLSFDPGDSITFGFTLGTKQVLFPAYIMFKAYSTKILGGTIFRKFIYAALATWAALFIGFLVTGVNLRNYKEKQKNDVRIILQSMNTFISFIDAKDPYTRGHSRRVAMYAAEIAKRMRLSEDEIQNIYYAGLLHDAGKISIPDVFRALNTMTLYNDVFRPKAYYNGIVSSTSGGRASDCIACGQCESVCPQHLPVIELMQEAAKKLDA